MQAIQCERLETRYTLLRGIRELGNLVGEVYVCAFMETWFQLYFQACPFMIFEMYRYTLFFWIHASFSPLGCK